MVPVDSVAMAVVHVVDVIAVLDGLMAAVGAVHVVVAVAGPVAGGLALVVVTVVGTVQVAVVGVVDVIAVRHRGVAAAGAVDVVVGGVLEVCCGHQNLPLLIERIGGSGYPQHISECASVQIAQDVLTNRRQRFR
ncbi:hypothetical protein GCM10027088_28290 [Nocardia goodfellowii]